MSRFGDWVSDNALSIWIAFSLCLVSAFFGALAMAVSVAGEGGPIGSFGGPAEPCYPNRTCDEGLTCWSLGEDEYECRAEVAPVKGRP